MTTPVTILNPGFDTDANDWELRTVGGATLNWSGTGGDSGGSAGCIVFGATGEGQSVALLPLDALPITPGNSITLSAKIRLAAGSPGSAASLNLLWYGPSGALSTTSSPIYNRKHAGSEYFTASVTGTPPSGATVVYPAIFADSGTGTTTQYFDSFSWNNTIPDLHLQFPAEGSVYAFGASVPFRIDGYTGLAITSVKYKVEDVATATTTTVGTASSSPWSINDDSLPAAEYRVWAEVNIGGYTITTASNHFTVGAPPPADTREFKASNAYTYLVCSNISNIANALPSTARVVGTKISVDYKVKALVRSKDLGLPDPSVARYAAAFLMVPSMSFECTLLDTENGTYTSLGNKMSNQFDIVESDFEVTEDGLAGDWRWTVLEGDPDSIDIGDEDQFFGLDPMATSDFLNKSIGIRAIPNLGPKPSYADSGDACFRVFIDKLRIQVFFDGGSVEYYFVSPDATKVIKGELVHYCVDDGDLRNGDAMGSLQLKYDLEVIDGTQTYVGSDWTVHSEYPSTDANKIADVEPTSMQPDVETPITVGMEYNSLPTQYQVMENGSRYEFITHNFYGDKDWDAVYGVNGYDKAFSFNGDWFYKICTNPDADKDKPRHVSDHHQHLALGFPEGRVDISSVGQPYNYDGFLGASSWAIGDTVTGLLPLSGTILGVFGAKTIWGISGTTVDNFDTQILVPKLGAIEYTIVDMGYPVYANAYGIYTLAQTQQYGDYLGTPMSIDVSPWLRPRLLRSKDSPIGTVAAWPVRHKNQYRLSFKDGMVLTMTINAGNQQAPTFSFQKYTLEDQDRESL